MCVNSICVYASKRERTYVSHVMAFAYTYISDASRINIVVSVIKLM